MVVAYVSKRMVQSREKLTRRDNLKLLSAIIAFGILSTMGISITVTQIVSGEVWGKSGRHGSYQLLSTLKDDPFDFYRTVVLFGIFSVVITGAFLLVTIAYLYRLRESGGAKVGHGSGVIITS